LRAIELSRLEPASVLIVVAGVRSPAVGVTFWIGILVTAGILIPGPIIRLLTIVQSVG
jgi:hypothetical protein